MAASPPAGAAFSAAWSQPAPDVRNALREHIFGATASPLWGANTPVCRGKSEKKLDDGTIRFRCDTLTVSITPRDELIKVKEEEE